MRADLRGVLAVNTLSKRSSIPGYRSGFVAGAPELIALLKRFRPSVGTAPQTFVQRAAVAAWDDEQHVGAFVAGLAGAEIFSSPMVNEGGGIHVDGEGTVMVTRTVQLDPDRNPGWQAERAETELKAYLGVDEAVHRRELLGGELLAQVEHRVEGLAAVLGEARALLQRLDAEPVVEQEVGGLAVGHDSLGSALSAR